MPSCESTVMFPHAPSHAAGFTAVNEHAGINSCCSLLQLSLSRLDRRLRWQLQALSLLFYVSNWEALPFLISHLAQNVLTTNSSKRLLTVLKLTLKFCWQHVALQTVKQCLQTHKDEFTWGVHMKVKHSGLTAYLSESLHSSTDNLQSNWKSDIWWAVNISLACL